MGRFLPAALCAALLILTTACNTAEQDKAKQQARELEHKVNQAVGPVNLRDTQSAAAKLRQGGEDLRIAGEKAGVKLDRAALIARVKTKLATDIGLSTATGIDVEARGQIITLKGSVSSEDQKQQAAQSVSQLDGVGKVVNDLAVKP